MAVYVKQPTRYQLEDFDTTSGNTMDDNLPSPSSVGMYNYPGDFACEMPGYTGAGANIAGQVDGVPGATADYPLGQWSTPEAYPWGKTEYLTTDPQVGGLPGDAFGVPFAFGPVESSTVEDFELRGAQAVFQAPDVMAFGDVGFLDFGGRLASAVSSYAYEQPNWENVAAAVVGGQ